MTAALLDVIGVAALQQAHEVLWEFARTALLLHAFFDGISLFLEMFDIHLS